MLRGREVQFAWNVGRMLLCIREDLATRRKTCSGWGKAVAAVFANNKPFVTQHA